jgi:ABC-type sugar transport system permease subunit
LSEASAMAFILLVIVMGVIILLFRRLERVNIR